MRRLSSEFTVNKELTTSAIVYLKKQITDFAEKDKCISILMDEGYTNQAVEYVGRSFSGTDVVNIVNVVNIAKKLFCLMVKKREIL